MNVSFIPTKPDEQYVPWSIMSQEPGFWMSSSGTLFVVVEGTSCIRPKVLFLGSNFSVGALQPASDSWKTGHEFKRVFGTLTITDSSDV